jgi:hypothetical protein
MGRILIFLIAGMGLLPGKGSDKPGAVSASEYINITVESNLDRQYFQYELTQPCLPVPGISEVSLEGLPLIGIRIPVKDFKCTNRLAYKDFLYTIKSAKYPWLYIDIPPYSEGFINSNNSEVLRNVSITVAGITRQYDITCNIIDSRNNRQVLDGSAVMKLTDFGIDPPVRFMGLIRVRNEITINFRLCLRAFRKPSVSPEGY